MVSEGRTNNNNTQGYSQKRRTIKVNEQLIDKCKLVKYVTK